MGRASRERPVRLAEKLKQIREALDLSQDGILIKLGYQNSNINRSSISSYELGVNEPPLPVLLKYARAVNVIVDVLIDDEMNLPSQLPYLGSRPKF